MAKLTLRGIEKSYSGKVLHDIDLEVADGEFLVLVGPSGCGKSTLLRIVAGLIEPSAGEIEIDGERVEGLEPARRDVAMVFQNYALYPHMTVAKNLAFPLRMAGTSRAEIDARVAEVARLLSLEELLARKPNALSGGQMQRVALGRAIVRRPRLFLFDEPLSNLDAKLRGQMRSELRRLHSELGVTTLYVTHDQAEAMTMGSRICVLQNGRIEQVGEPLEVFAAPRTTFVARFIGAPPMNLVHGRWESGRFRPHSAGDGASRSGGGPAFEIDCPLAGAGEVQLGVRPQDLVLDADGALEFVVDAVEALGTATHARGRCGEIELVASLPATLALPTVGESLRLRPRQDALSWFGPDGVRIGAS